MLLLDLLYVAALVVLSPWLIWRAARTGRHRRDLAAKLLGRPPLPAPPPGPTAWFHGVSVGEVNLLWALVPAFQARFPGWTVVVSSTTDTGLAEARKRFPALPVIAWPFDFSWAAATALDRVRPALVVLAESELWPNFLHEAARRGAPVVVVNARMSPRSHRRLRLLGSLARRFLYGRVAHFAVQEEEYSARIRRLGVPAGRVTTTGSIKYDGAAPGRDAARSRELGRLLGLPEGRRPVVLLAGSTHAPEEAIVLGAFARLRQRFPSLRLILVPRHPDRFAEVARLVHDAGVGFVRRSELREPPAEAPAVVLLDTVGELGAAWGLADLGFTGGSLDGRRGGQSMIEPAGYGVPCVFGPHVWNFKDAARRLVEVGGAVVVRDGAELEAELARLIADEPLRRRMGAAARDLVARQQGATARTLDVVARVIGPAPAP